MFGRGPIAILSAALLAAPATAASADGAKPSSGGVDLTLGAGAAFVPEYEGSDEYHPVPAWNLRVGNLYGPNTYVSIRGLRLESNLLPSENFRLGITAHYQSDYDDVDDDAVSELERPSNAIQAGVVAGYEITDDQHIQYGLEVEATYDVLHGNGALVTPRARIRLPITQEVLFNSSIAVSWASSDYMSNRFGISDADAARSGLRPFDTDAGFKDAELGLGVTYLITKNWSFSMSGSYQRMLEDAADSPIVDNRGSRDNFRAAALVNYHF
ncbi:MAG TPA: MipA/OmpV family protein [Dongiaceae bacterium]|jgi:outer membrane protein|nr:MipA/OmpV family protein [Dongiaceae bacterium]